MKKILLLSVLFISIIFTSCTTTKHILKRTEKVKVYKASEVLTSYGLDKPKNNYGMTIPPVTFDADYLMGFSFSEQNKEKAKNHYPPAPINAGENPLYVQKIYVNIDLCKRWKHLDSSLEKVAYGKNYSSFNPTEYKLFISLNELKKRQLVPNNPTKQDDICVYLKQKTMGHSGVFKDKSNKIHYSESEINDARVTLEKRR